MKMRFSKFFGLIVTLIVLLSANPVLAAVHFGVSGTVSTSNLGLETTRKQSGKGSVAIDLGSYFRLGYSFRKIHEQEENYRRDEDTSNLYRSEQDMVLDVHAFDLIAILYAGELFTPFVFVGAAWKYYDISYYDEEEGRGSNQLFMGPVENYGGGLSISLNKDFSLKVTTTWSPGWKINPDDPDGKLEKVRDVQTDIGLSYRFH